MPISTQSVASGENVAGQGSDVEFESGLGTALLTQTVTGDRAGVIGFGTVSPISTQSVANGDNVDSVIPERVGTGMTDMGLAMRDKNATLAIGQT